MTLTELRTAHPSLIRQDHTWWLGEPFASRKADYCVGGAVVTSASDLAFRVEPELAQRRLSARRLPSAATLVALYVLDPTNALWDHWLWCADLDSRGQRVYVGVMNGLLEVHRHLHLTERWGVVEWK